MGQSKGHRYDEQFQRDAVDLWIKSGKPAYKVAEELGISDGSLQRWKAKYLAEAGGPQQKNLQAENERLKREVSELRQEREILKKSVAIFLKPQK